MSADQSASGPRFDAGTSDDSHREFLRLILDAIPDPVFVKDGALRFIAVNDALCSFVGVSRDHLIGKSDHDFFPKREADVFRERDAQVLASGEENTNEEQLTDSIGQTKWISTKKCAIRLPDGSPILVGVIRDITQIRQQAAILRANERQLRTIMDELPAIITHVSYADNARRYTFANRAYCRSVGRDVSQIVGHTVAEVTGVAAYERVGVVIDRVALGERIQYEREHGATVLAFDIIPDRDEHGVVVGHYGFGTDITAERRAKEAISSARAVAEEASRAKSQFLATMSHEIRTPMNGVLGMTELLLDTALDEEQRRFVMMAHRSGEALLGIINDILDLSKIEAGKLELEAIEFNVWQIAEDVAELLAERAQGKGLELSCQIDEDVPMNAIGDPGRLRQILTNLVNNAIKFTETGEVNLLVRRVDGCAEPGKDCRIRFEIVDTGIGMTPEVQSRLFLPFAQADSTTTRKYGGTGLGLAICRQLVEAMSGAIEVESAPGRGALFRISVCLETAPATQTYPRAGQAALVGRRVLVVDDNATNLNIVRRQTAALGMVVDTARDGFEALERLRAALNQAPYDVAIIDMKMPGMSGVELAYAMRAEQASRAPRLVMLTSLMPSDGVRAARQAGILAYLNKPVRRAELERVLREVINTPGSSTGAAGVPSDVVKPSNGRVLLAEDNPVNKTVAVSMLRRLGFTVEVAGNGAEAVDAYRRGGFDLILMDCQMPVMDGYEASAAIRATELSGVRVPIVALTANAVQGDRERCLAAGMDDYLSKPFRKEQLMAILKRYCAVAASLTP